MGFVNRLITWIMDRLSVEVDPDAEMVLADREKDGCGSSPFT